MTTQIIKGSAAKSAFWTTVSTFVANSIAFLAMPVFTRLLAPEEYGMVNSYAAWYTVLLIVVTLSLEASVNKASFDFESDMYGYLSSMMGLTLLSVGICYIGLNAYQSIFNIEVENYITQNYMFLNFLFTPATNMFIIAQRFQFKYKIPILIAIITTITSVGFALAGIYLFPGNKYTAQIVGTYLGALIIGITITVYIFIKGKTFFKRKYWKFGLFYAVPMIFHFLGLQILNQSDRIMIQMIRGGHETGLYSVAYNTCKVISVLWSSILVGFNPWLFRKLDAGAYSETKDVGRKLLSAAFFAVITFICFADIVMRIFASEAYYAGIWAIPPVAAGIFFMCIYTIYMTVESHHRKPHYSAIGTIAAAVINLILNYIFINLYGYIAAAYTTLFCYILLAVFHIAIVRKIDKNEIFPSKYLLGLGGLCIILGGLFMALYAYPVYRYTCYAIFLVIMLVKFRKELMAVYAMAKKPEDRP